MPSMLSETTTLLVFFRVIGGLGIGIASMNASMYVAEIAPAEKRGTLVTFYQLAIVIIIVFVWKFIPETKGKTLEEKETLF